MVTASKLQIIEWLGVKDDDLVENVRSKLQGFFDQCCENPSNKHLLFLF